MRAAFFISFVANMILTVVALVISPASVAIRFGPGGAPSSWAPAYVDFLIMSGVHILLLASFLLAPRLTRMTPSRWIHIPNKAYWLKAENRSKMESLLSGRLFLFGTITFAFLFVVSALALQANLSTPVNFREDIFWWPFGLFMLYMVYWTIETMLAFRIPKA